MTFTNKKKLKEEIKELERQVKHLETYIEDDRKYWQKRIQDVRDHHAAEWERNNDIIEERRAQSYDDYRELAQLNEKHRFIIARLLTKAGLGEAYGCHLDLLYNDLKAEVTESQEKSAKKARKARLKGE